MGRLKFLMEMLTTLIDQRDQDPFGEDLKLLESTADAVLDQAERLNRSVVLHLYGEYLEWIDGGGFVFKPPYARRLE